MPVSRRAAIGAALAAPVSSLLLSGQAGAAPTPSATGGLIGLDEFRQDASFARPMVRAAGSVEPAVALPAVPDIPGTRGSEVVGSDGVTSSGRRTLPSGRTDAVGGMAAVSSSRSCST